MIKLSHHWHLVAFVGAVSLLNATVPPSTLAFERVSILHGEPWRIITGNLVHTNTMHALLNLGSCVAIYSLFCDHLDRCRLFTLMTLLWLSVGLGIWWWCPQTEWYMGLSGSLHGLFAWGAVQDIRTGRRTSGWMLLAGLLMKLFWDHYTGGQGLISEMIDARVHIGSHLLGSVTGIVLSLCSLRFTLSAL
ncbi:rhombosortase [Aeromonas dhakensis]|uniref:rhombosortase n=1 Tax=Aeromonas dhakensis TaxID=196024 RepID=UPI00398694BC